jgi:hypothetical protein
LIEVPKEVHDNYDYQHPVPFNINVTPIFKKLKEASLTLNYQNYSWDISSWFRTFTEFLLLICSIYISFEKEYTRQKYNLSLYMGGLLAIALLYL